MSTKKIIPFRPKLEGVFKTRFYNTASKIVPEVPLDGILDIVKQEILWVENECAYSTKQRNKYKAIWLLFRDLIQSSWTPSYEDGVLNMIINETSILNTQIDKESVNGIKKTLRAQLLESRNERLRLHAKFINNIEKGNGNTKSILELIADGPELYERLKRFENGETDINSVIQPYLQLVAEGDRDKFSNIPLAEIWRYCRFTWSMPYEITPGRTMQYLIRDASHPMHAIMGIISLENCTISIGCRDEYIGWHINAFTKKISGMDSSGILNELSNLLKYIEDGISSVDCTGLCEVSDLISPTDEIIYYLSSKSEEAEQKRQKSLIYETKKPAKGFDKSELGKISKNTEKELYLKKRADKLSRLLRAKKTISEFLVSGCSEDDTKLFMNTEEAQQAVRAALTEQKNKHIGTSMLCLNTCGALPPYNEILSGKLAALLAVSPQVIYDYKKRYEKKASDIASRLKGTDVVRPADLVYIETTSLYSVGSSQYNRLKIPGAVFESPMSVKFKEIGKTVGYGTLHISAETTSALSGIVNEEYKRTNHVFGEGPSPKMRIMASAIGKIFEGGESAKEFTKHAMSRLVYGVELAENTINYLMGQDNSPLFYTDIENYKQGTLKMVDFWRERWFSHRLRYEPIFERIRKFDKQDFVVSRFINQTAKTEGIMSLPKKNNEPLVLSSEPKGVEFIRFFYRGESGYSDHVSADLLARIHLSTKLDESILQNLNDGKDVILTGNPGDGKTHIIRVLEPQLEEIQLETLIDASTMSDNEIYNKWKSARDNNKQFLMAINAAVLFNLYESYPDVEFIKSAYEQMFTDLYLADKERDDKNVVLFDLSKREILTQEILNQAIAKLTHECHFAECKRCGLFSACDVHKHRQFINKGIFKERLYSVLKIVAFRGYHATLREVLSLTSYLIFGERTCNKLKETSSEDKYDVSNLVYTGKGRLFDEIRSAFDPAITSHPITDEKIINNEFTADTWNGYEVPYAAIPVDDNKQLELRKRQFYFFNNNGDDFLKIFDDDTSGFMRFLEQDDTAIKKEVISFLNKFFNKNDAKSPGLHLYFGHRYNNESRKILVSVSEINRKELSVRRPSLNINVSGAFEMRSNYLWIEKDENSSLKIDLRMYKLLKDIERGVPVLFMQSVLIDKIWRFIEQLQITNTNIDEQTEILLFDVINNKKIKVRLETDDDNYMYSMIKDAD